MLDTRRLEDLRGVGPAIRKDFAILGIKSVKQLSRHDGKRLYCRLCDIKGSRQDPCVEDTLVCAVAQARNPNLPVEQRDWWYWSRIRKSC